MLRSLLLKFRLQNNRGSATLEFIVFAIPIITPLVAGAVALMRIHEGEMRVDFAVREAIHVLKGAPNSEVGVFQGTYVAKDAMKNFGDGLTFTFICSANPCLTPGARVTARVAGRIDGGLFSRRILVSHSETVDLLVEAK